MASHAWQKAKTPLPTTHARIYVWQLCRALGQIHAAGICHRDIKPQNLLLDPKTHVVKLIDFGSAKVLVPGEPNVSYICSRYYRAPELIFGSTEYTTAIDVWSSGCVFAELLLGAPLFPGDSGVDQLVEIIKVLGHAVAGRHPGDERVVHGVQVPSNQGARLGEGLSISNSRRKQ